MEREIKKITAPSGKEVEMKTYLTARERNQLRDVFLADMKINPNTNQMTNEISGSAMTRAQDDLIKVAVVKFDGSTENIMDRILDGSPDDYDFIVTEANKIQSGNLSEAK